MQILPDREQGKPLAIGLVLVLLILVYLLGFHWFIMRHVDLSNEISDLQDQIARFKGVAEERGPLEAELESLRLMRSDSALFLPQSSFSAAAAGMNRRLRDIISSEAEFEEFCTVSSTQNRPAQDDERFEPVTVNVRMECPLPDLVRVLYELENGIPLVFINELTVNQRATPGRRTRGVTPGVLDVRFDMVGYLPEHRGR